MGFCLYQRKVVEVPFPGLMQELIELAKRNPHEHSMDSYIFWAEKKADKPISATDRSSGNNDV